MRWMLAFAVALGVGVRSGWAQSPPTDKKTPPDPEQVFKKLDKNGDKSLTLAELKEHPRIKNATAAEKAFKAMDTNASGGVSLDEFKAWAKKISGGKKT